VKVVLLDRALAQLVKRFDYVAAENVEAAYRVMERILEALRQLDVVPKDVVDRN
jgi:plasmid stabilization system protein ParE